MKCKAKGYNDLHQFWSCNEPSSKDGYCWAHYYGNRGECIYGYENHDPCLRVSVRDNGLCREHFDFTQKLISKQYQSYTEVEKKIGWCVVVGFAATILTYGIALVIAIPVYINLKNEMGKIKSDFNELISRYGTINNGFID